MPIEATKPDVRERLTALTVVLVCLLTVVAFALAFSWEAAGYWLLFIAAGFVVARVLARQRGEMPVPRAVQRKWLKGSLRRAAFDEPFNTRLGWTTGSEPGGTLPDARRVTPYGRFGGGLWADSIAGLLVMAAVLFQFARTGSPVGVILVFSVAGLAGFALIRFTRWLRHR